MERKTEKPQKLTNLKSYGKVLTLLRQRYNLIQSEPQEKKVNYENTFMFNEQQRGNLEQQEQKPKRQLNRTSPKKSQYQQMMTSFAHNGIYYQRLNKYVFQYCNNHLKQNGQLLPYKYKSSNNKVVITFQKTLPSSDRSFRNFQKLPQFQQLTPIKQNQLNGSQTERTIRSFTQPKNIREERQQGQNQESSTKLNKNTALTAYNTNIQITEENQKPIVNDGQKYDTPDRKQTLEQANYDNYLKSQTPMQPSHKRLTVLNDNILKFQKQESIVPQQRRSQTQPHESIVPSNRSSFSEAATDILALASLSQAGMNYDKNIKTNQDSFYENEDFYPPQFASLFIVCDGHGTDGHKISQIAIEVLQRTIRNQIKQCNKPQAYKSCILDAFNQTQKTLLKKEYIDTTLSGSTCITVLMINKELYIANLGDSRAILAFNNSDNMIQVLNGKIYQQQAKNLSEDHKPENPKEYQRIEANGGSVYPYKDENGVIQGPPRVWKKNNTYPGLAMSRSFADTVGAECGVISEPEITTYELTYQDKFLILASDGIWEFLSSQEVVDIVHPFYINNQADRAAQRLVEIATQLWKKNDGVIDDITCIIIFLKR